MPFCNAPEYNIAVNITTATGIHRGKTDGVCLAAAMGATDNGLFLFCLLAMYCTNIISYSATFLRFGDEYL
jgi:hypothetical protein